MKINPILAFWCAVLTLAVWVAMWIAVKAHYWIRDQEQINESNVHNISGIIKLLEGKLP